ncbi:hypothetical protein GCM10007881_51180 [Mesorhizobium huakuii]|nr:hypothetical protein GCM10007881_51180 [Mesorhizobium huakuii]
MAAAWFHHISDLADNGAAAKKARTMQPGPSMSDMLPRAAAEGGGVSKKTVKRQFIVGMTNSAPSLMPDGQREVTVLVLV